MDRSCEECADLYVAKRGNQKYCTVRCSLRANKRRQRAKRDDRHEARALLRSMLRQRDGDLCGICGLTVGNAPHPDPLSPSVDHIIPVSAGGGRHDAANVQLVHLACNTRKARAK